jgi:hypothetical protein
MEAVVKYVAWAIAVLCIGCGERRDGLTFQVDGLGEVFVPNVHPGDVFGHPDSTFWHAVAPYDTAALIRMLDLPKGRSIDIGRYGTVGREWYAEEDTLLLSYMAFACTCPNFLSEDTTRSAGITAFYTRPLVDLVAIPEAMRVSGNIFELIGWRSVDTLAPPRTMGPPMPGYSFLYRSFRVIPPYTAWGPNILEPSLSAHDTVDLWSAPMWLSVGE